MTLRLRYHRAGDPGLAAGLECPRREVAAGLEGGVRVALEAGRLSFDSVVHVHRGWAAGLAGGDASGLVEVFWELRRRDMHPHVAGTPRVPAQEDRGLVGELVVRQPVEELVHGVGRVEPGTRGPRTPGVDGGAVVGVHALGARSNPLAVVDVQHRGVGREDGVLREGHLFTLRAVVETPVEGLLARSFGDRPVGREGQRYCGWRHCSACCREQCGDRSYRHHFLGGETTAHAGAVECTSSTFPQVCEWRE